MRLYKTFESKNDAERFAKKMEAEKRLAMIRQRTGSGVMFWDVVYFMSPEDRNNDLGGEYGEKVEL